MCEGGLEQDVKTLCVFAREILQSEIKIRVDHYHYHHYQIIM